MRLKKHILTLAFLSTTTLHAGGMGAVQASAKQLTPFLAAEAAYTWSDIQPYNINIINEGLFTAENVNQGWGGRIAAGLLEKMSDRFSASAEMGWAYYGRVLLNPKLIVASGAAVIPTEDTMHMNLDQYGLDLLAGIMYTQPKYDLFFKAGALFENLRLDASLDMAELVRQSPTLVTEWNGTQDVRINLPQVLPEIKLGGAYHITEQTSVTLSWMHAFGSTFSIEIPGMQFNPTSLGNMTYNLQSPTLNSVMFGLEHRFS